MVLDRITSCPDRSNQAASANGLSRRTLLQVGAVAGGSLVLSLRLPFAIDEAEAAHAHGFTPNAFVRIDSDGQIVLTMPYVEMGQERGIHGCRWHSSADEASGIHNFERTVHSEVLQLKTAGTGRIFRVTGDKGIVPMFAS